MYVYIYIYMCVYIYIYIICIWTPQKARKKYRLLDVHIPYMIHVCHMITFTINIPHEYLIKNILYRRNLNYFKGWLFCTRCPGNGTISWGVALQTTFSNQADLYSPCEKLCGWGLGPFFLQGYHAHRFLPAYNYMCYTSAPLQLSRE